jgi:hypothetical protein
VGSAQQMNVLVVTSEPIGAQQLRDVLGSDLDPASTEVMVIAPALQRSPLKFWLTDVDAAIERADAVRLQTLARLEDEGVSAASDTGESDPMQAIEDTLRTFDADRIVLFAHPEGDERYREDIDPEEVESRFGLPLDRAVLNY